MDAASGPSMISALPPKVTAPSATTRVGDVRHVGGQQQ
jgi:hypothetical protein